MAVWLQNENNFKNLSLCCQYTGNIWQFLETPCIMHSHICCWNAYDQKGCKQFTQWKVVSFDATTSFCSSLSPRDMLAKPTTMPQIKEMIQYQWIVSPQSSTTNISNTLHSLHIKSVNKPSNQHYYSKILNTQKEIHCKILNSEHLHIIHIHNQRTHVFLSCCIWQILHKYTLIVYVIRLILLMTLKISSEPNVILNMEISYYSLLPPWV